MLELIILSPHRDDAAFSLSIALFCWRKLPVKLTVVNIFTQSEYAPHALSTRVSTISAGRKIEDSLALRSIDPLIQVESLDLLDAPLRFGIPVDAISRPETAALESSAEIDGLAACIRRYFTRGLVLAPLALGDHVDHLAVKRAALVNSRHHKLGFYEDLPYATWTSSSSLCGKVLEAETHTRVSLRPSIIRSSAFAAAHKRQVIAKYHSQVNSDGVTAIANYASKYGGGERVWTPKYGKPWKLLMQYHA
jgi:GlcNAc-PI de-N-acetylase